MSKNLYVTVIDLGSNRLKGLVGEVGEKGLRVLASAMMKTKGMENGDISDAVAFKDAVENLVLELETQEPKQSESVYCIVLSDGYTNLRTSSVEEKFQEKVVVDDDLLIDVIERFHEAEAIQRENTQAFEPMVGEERILHIVPRRYIIDGVKSVSNPLDMEVSSLGVEASIIFTDRLSIDTLENLLDDLSITGFPTYSGIFVSSEYCLGIEEKNRGVVLLDLGYSRSTILMYFKGAPIHLCSVPLGMANILKDIMNVLGTSLDEAERLFIHHGCAFPEYIKDDENVSYNLLDGKKQGEVSLKKLSLIIYARLREILGLVKREIKKVEISMIKGEISGIPGGVVLIGGGAKLKNVVDVAQEIFKMPVRIGKIEQEIDYAEDIADNPIYVPVISAFLWFSEHEIVEEGVVESVAKVKKRVNPLKKLWELFKKLV